MEHTSIAETTRSRLVYCTAYYLHVTSSYVDMKIGGLLKDDLSPRSFKVSLETNAQ